MLGISCSLNNRTRLVRWSWCSSAHLADAMAACRMTVVDGQFYWMSAKVSNDQFRFYAPDVQLTRFNCVIDKVSYRA